MVWEEIEISPEEISWKNSLGLSAVQSSGKAGNTFFHSGGLGGGVIPPAVRAEHPAEMCEEKLPHMYKALALSSASAKSKTQNTPN